MRTREKGLLALVVLALGALAVSAWIFRTIEPRLDADTMPAHILEAPAAAHAAAVARGQELARARIADQNLPGLSLAVAVDGEVVWAEGFGWADYQAEIPATPQTRFRIGGVTKTITAVAAGLLHERGALDLDAPVRRYVPAFPERRWPLTTRQLLGHVAGIRPGWSGRGSPCTDDLERITSFAADTLRFRPGTRFQYSTRGYVLVGAVIAAAAGEPYLEFIRREILAPLGMRNTVADGEQDDPSVTARFYFPRLATDPKLGLQDAPPGELSCVLPAIGLLSTPSDLARLGSAMLDTTLLRAGTVATLQRPLRLESGETSEAGLGWFERSLPAGEGEEAIRVVGHRGNVAGGTTSLVIAPEHGLAVAVTSNVTFATAVSEIADGLTRIFARELTATR